MRAGNLRFSAIKVPSNRFAAPLLPLGGRSFFLIISNINTS